MSNKLCVRGKPSFLSKSYESDACPNGQTLHEDYCFFNFCLVIKLPWQRVCVWQSNAAGIAGPGTVGRKHIFPLSFANKRRICGMRMLQSRNCRLAQQHVVLRQIVDHGNGWHFLVLVCLLRENSVPKAGSQKRNEAIVQQNISKTQIRSVPPTPQWISVSTRQCPQGSDDALVWHDRNL